MALNNYTALQGAIEAYLGRTDLSAYYADFILQAEARMNRTLRTREMEASTSLSLTAGAATLPSDFLECQSVTWVGTRTQDLRYAEPDSEQWVYRYRPNGDPTMFTLKAGSLYVRPVATGNVTLVYYQAIPALVTNATNWLLTKAPDLYLDYSLMEAAIFVKDDERAAEYYGLATKEAEKLIVQSDANKISRRPSHDVGVQDKATARSNQTGPV